MLVGVMGLRVAISRVGQTLSGYFTSTFRSLLTDTHLSRPPGLAQSLCRTGERLVSVKAAACRFLLMEKQWLTERYYSRALTERVGGGRY